MKSFFVDSTNDVASMLRNPLVKCRLGKVIFRAHKMYTKMGYHKDIIGLIIAEFVHLAQENVGKNDEVINIHYLLDEPETLLARRRQRMGSEGFPLTGHQREIVKLTLPKTDPNYLKNYEMTMTFVQVMFEPEKLTINQLRALLKLVVASQCKGLAVIRKDDFSAEQWALLTTKHPDRIIQDRMVLINGETIEQKLTIAA